MSKKHLLLSSIILLASTHLEAMENSGDTANQQDAPDYFRGKKKTRKQVQKLTLEKKVAQLEQVQSYIECNLEGSMKATALANLKKDLETVQCTIFARKSRELIRAWGRTSPTHF